MIGGSRACLVLPTAPLSGGEPEAGSPASWLGLQATCSPSAWPAGVKPTEAPSRTF